MQMQRTVRKFVPAAFLLLAMGVHAQTMKSDHWSSAELLERAKHLRQLAAQGDGSASETLEKYPNHYTMLAFRSRPGGGEVHQSFADLFYIVDGRASLVTGGEIVEPKTTVPGEIRGSSVKGGTRQDLQAGDVVHIPAGMPHQMLLEEGQTVTYFVLKAQESQ
jgi:mannose-6-phosphate isomerase-like protein (cupin superfamily)